MYCNQCEQTAGGTGCITASVCGKTEEAAGLQNAIINALRGLGLVAVEGRKVGITDLDAERFTVDALFSTLTNVDFDPESLRAKLVRAEGYRDSLAERVAGAGGLVLEGPKGEGSPWDESRDGNVQSLQQTVIYGLKGVAAYAHHARILGQEDREVYAFMLRALAAISDDSLSLQDWVDLALETGKVNLRALELLDEANTGTYGHPVPTEVPLGHRPNRAVLVSGHDLRDLELVLRQTEGKDIDVYTHGEMLPAHGYPELKKYPHLYGHYGTAWQNQKREFAEFPGAILVTTNCLTPPKDVYKDNLFTSGPVEFPGVEHISGEDFSHVVDKALEMPGFTDEADKGTVLVGFARNTVLGVAPQVIEAVKNGDIRHFFLVGGCDGVKSGRNYYSDLVEKAPADTVVLTLACGKFRFFDKKLGDIGGIPRLLDVGQCNDAYSAIQIATALAQAFEVGVNDLPLSIVLSWYEQKAVAILLSLLYLGIKDIRLGPSLPAFITPDVLQVLVDTFGIKPIGESAEDDLAEMLGEPVSA